MPVSIYILIAMPLQVPESRGPFTKLSLTLPRDREICAARPQTTVPRGWLQSLPGPLASALATLECAW